MMLTKRAIIKLRLTTIAVILIVIAAAAACSSDNGDTPALQPQVPQGDAAAGAPLVRVPDLRGYPLEAVIREFESLGFSPSPAVFISDEPEDTVLFIDRIGQLLPVPATIEVFVSGGAPDRAPEAPPGDEPATEGPKYERMRFGGIDWLVLEEKEGKVLLLSHFVSFDMQYNDQLISTAWETSSIRSYLNNEFFNSFSPEDRSRIAETRVINEHMPYVYAFGDTGLGIQSWPVPAGNDTYDRIFLLSHEEQRRYFANDSERMAPIAGDHPWHGSGYANWWWWLRSPGRCTFSAGLVGTDGMDIIGFIITSEVGVRPALWLYVD